LERDVERSLSRGCAWLTALIDERGRIGNSDLATLYYKVPAALALNGALGPALRTLDWISTRFLNSSGDLAIPPEQGAGRAYDRAWLVWGASLCGRYDIAFRLADDLRSYQNRATGGFWDSRQALDTNCGTHHAMTAGMAGLALLSVRYLVEAQEAAEFLIQLLDRQTSPEESFHMVVQVSAAGEQSLRIDGTPLDSVDRRKPRQLPAQVGPIQNLFVRLYRLFHQSRHLTAARRYTEVFLGGARGIYDCVEAHKFMWGLAELHELAPEERFLKAGDRIRDYIVARQQPDGQWWGDAVGGGKQGQPLELRLNTTCNVLVGLGYYAHHAAQRPAAQRAAR
jgi:hypothetical protein